jgi:hypothetical protein
MYGGLLPQCSGSYPRIFGSSSVHVLRNEIFYTHVQYIYGTVYRQYSTGTIHLNKTKICWLYGTRVPVPGYRTAGTEKHFPEHDD